MRCGDSLRAVAAVRHRAQAWVEGNHETCRSGLARACPSPRQTVLPVADLCFPARRFKRLDESLAEIQSLVVGHLHALRSQFQTARELSAKLAACSRADTVRVSRLLGASTDSGSASVADTDPDACESSGADAATSGESGRVDDGDSEGGMTLVAPAEYFDEPEAHEPHRLHARLLADQRHLSAVATALTRQQRAHEALGAATVQAAERLLGAAALAPAARLRDALAKLRPTMDKRRRNHTDVAAYARRVSRYWGRC